MNDDRAAERTIQLNDGTRMPLLGLGTWKTCSSQVFQGAVEAAIAAGYRHLDTAYSYRNEVDVGRALRAKMDQGIIRRQDMFIVSKLWCTYHAPGDVALCLSKSLRDLHLEYLDLYLVHFPVGLQRVDDELFPMKDGEILSTDIDYADVWKEMEAVQATGKVKSIGVSNFNISQLERLLAVAKVPPAVNQVELHPYLVQSDLIQFCKSRNIALTAYSPLGSPGRAQELHRGATDPEKLMEDPVVNAVAKKHRRTSAQVYPDMTTFSLMPNLFAAEQMTKAVNITRHGWLKHFIYIFTKVLLRYHVQQGIAVIPKSIKPNHLLENTKIFDFSLDEEDMKALQGLDRGWKACVIDLLKSHPYYPFN